MLLKNWQFLSPTRDYSQSKVYLSTSYNPKCRSEHYNVRWWCFPDADLNCRRNIALRVVLAQRAAILQTSLDGCWLLSSECYNKRWSPPTRTSSLLRQNLGKQNLARIRSARILVRWFLRTKRVFASEANFSKCEEPGKKSDLRTFVRRRGHLVKVNFCFIYIQLQELGWLGLT